MICLKGSINVNRMEMDKFLDIVKEGKTKIENETLSYVKIPYNISMFLIKDMQLINENGVYSFSLSTRKQFVEKSSGILICFSYDEKEELVRIDVKPYNITYLHTKMNNEGENYKLIDYLHTSISEKDGENELEKYKEFIKDIVLESIKTEFGGIEVLETNSLSLFEATSQEALRDIINNIIGESMESENLYSYIINNFKELTKNGDYGIYRSDSDLYEFSKKFGSLIVWILGYFKYIPIDVIGYSELWYVHNKFSKSFQDNHYYIVYFLVHQYHVLLYPYPLIFLLLTSFFLLIYILSD